MYRLLQRREAGDTIVEVMISIAIISLVLVGAYVATSRNTLQLQNAQEREQAQRLVESQIELLRNAVQAGQTVTNGGCYSNSGTEQTGSACSTNTVAGSGATYTQVIATPNDSWPSVGGHAPPCQAPATNAYTYTVCTYWTSLGGTTDNDSNVTMYYEPYKPS